MKLVMLGLVPGIHDFACGKAEDVVAGLRPPKQRL